MGTRENTMKMMALSEYLKPRVRSVRTLTALKLPETMAAATRLIKMSRSEAATQAPLAALVSPLKERPISIPAGLAATLLLVMPPVGLSMEADMY
jgi:hypothetical protein